MLRYQIVSRENGRNVYEYRPDGDGRPGFIAMHDNGRREIIEDSPDDFMGLYRGHAFSGIDISRDSGTVAWY